MVNPKIMIKKEFNMNSGYFMKFKKMLIVVSLLGLILLPVSTSHASSITMVDFSWESVQVHNRIAGFILENAYDMEADYLFAESMPGLLGVERGDIDVVMECWIENFHEWWTKVGNTDIIHNSGKVFEDAPQGWYVPDYVIKGDKSRGIEPFAPDLKSVFDLKKYWKVFEEKSEPGKGRLYNGPSGWVAHTINKEKIKAYGLEDVLESFNPGSQTSLAAAISAAYEKGEPILAYGWEPTTIMGMYDMILLEEPPYDEEVWEENYGCGTDELICYIVLNGDFSRANPEVTKFFDKYQATINQTNKALAYMKKNDEGPEEAAIWFLNEYPEVWESWITGEGKILSVKRALEAK